MSYIEGYEDNYSSNKIPYDDIPISRRPPRKKPQRVSVSSFKILVSIVAVMFIVNIGLCIALVYHAKHAVVKDVVVNNNNITAVGDSAIAIAADTAWWSSVCVAAGGSCYNETTFYKNTISRGSGVIYKIDEKNSVAYIITCNHVIEGHDKYYIMLPSMLKPLVAEKVGGSKHYDVAVLKVEYSINTFDSCTQIQIFDSTFSTIGETVLAVGNSLSGGLSVTTGIISRINTMIEVEGNDFDSREIQTDAAINPGNSGGGLFNNEGKFVGLVNAKLNTTQSGSSNITVAGTAFAIPSKLVISLVDSMIYYEGSPKCINLGVDFFHDAEVGPNPEIVNGKQITTYKVRAAAPKSASLAEDGGIQKNDVIKKVKFTDIFGNEQEVNIYNKYSFEDIKFIIKKDTVVTFYVERSFVNGLKELNIAYTSSITY